MYIAIYKILGEHSSKIMYSLNSRRIKLNKCIQATHNYYDNHWIKWEHRKRTCNALLETQGKPLIEIIS